jgi:hypothetical protein
MAQDKAPQRTTSFNTKLAKAETLLALALLTDLVIYPWLFSQTTIPPAGKTIIKMALVVGMFGPLQNLLSGGIDRTLKATRNVTSSFLSLPRMGIHVAIMSVLFVSFYWSMHHSLPWAGMFPHESRQARADKSR